MAIFLNGSLTRRALAVTVQILLLLLPPSSHRRYNPTRCVIRQEVLCLLFVVAPLRLCLLGVHNFLSEETAGEFFL